MGSRRDNNTPAAVKKIGRWVRSRSVREKVGMGALAALLLFVLLKLYAKTHYYFFVPSRGAHALGIFVLIYKLSISKTCAGISLKTQELTALYLIGRLVSSLSYVLDVHVALDFLALVATLWVIYMMRVKLRSTYMKELDTMPLHYVLVPCAITAVVAHPRANFSLFFRLLWPFVAAVEAISVLPQLRLIQNAKMVEPFTGHYVFALGVSRFFGCAYWIVQLMETKGAYLILAGSGNLWIILSLLCEVVQTFILADFCYYYVKSVMEGNLMVRLPSLV